MQITLEFVAARPAFLPVVTSTEVGSEKEIAELEFSDYGRDPRFVSGWWIVPGLLLGPTSWYVAFVVWVMLT